MFPLGWGEGGEAWKWRRRLWAREEDLVEECRTLLLIVSLQVDSLDVWSWFPDPTGGYSVRGAYRILTNRIPSHDAISSNLLWHQDVPLKVSVFAWRLFRNRLPTKVNLFSKGIISHESQLCVGGCGLLETKNHLFLECSFFGTIWQLVRHWLVVHSADSSIIMNHFSQFDNLLGFSKLRISFMLVFLFATSLVIWKEIHDRIFRDKKNSPI